MLALPTCLWEVQLALTYEPTNEYNKLLRQWRTRCTPRRMGHQKLGRRLKGIRENRDSGGEFKRDFVMHIISTSIISNINGNDFFNILKLLMDVNEIPVYNWCAYLLQCLNGTVVEWTQNPSIHFKGPPQFRMISEIVTNYLLNLSWRCCSFFYMCIWISFFTEWDVFLHYNKVSGFNVWNVIHYKMYKWTFILVMNCKAYISIEMRLEERDSKTDGFQ